MSEEEFIRYTVVLVGESGVGKSTIVTGYSDHKDTIGANYSTRIIKLEEEKKPLKFEILDTAGAETNRFVCTFFYKNAAAFILVYDITRRKTFEELKNFWIHDVKSKAPPDTSKNIYNFNYNIFI